MTLRVQFHLRDIVICATGHPQMFRPILAEPGALRHSLGEVHVSTQSQPTSPTLVGIRIGGMAVQASGDSHVGPGDEVVARAIHKAAWRLIPLLCVAYIISYID